MILFSVSVMWGYRMTGRCMLLPYKGYFLLVVTPSEVYKNIINVAAGVDRVVLISFHQSLIVKLLTSCTWQKLVKYATRDYKLYLLRKHTACFVVVSGNL